MEEFSGSALDDGAKGEESMATESEATSEKETESDEQVVSSRPAKRARKAPAKRKTTKKVAKRDDAGEEKPAKKAPRKKRVKVSEKKVVSSRPRKRTSKKKIEEKDKPKAEAQEEKPAETPKDSTEAQVAKEQSTTPAADASDSSPRWGRSQRRQQAPRIVTGETAADRVIESTSRPSTPPPAAVAGGKDAEPASEPTAETQAAPLGEEESQGGTEPRRSRGRGRPRRRRTGTRSVPRQEVAPPPPPPATPVQSVTEILAENWSEDRARKILSEGFLVSLAAPLTSDADVPSLDDGALADRLQVVRRVLADECMVEDDVTDVLMLDMVMSALGDRIEIYRMSVKGRDAAEMERILDLRYKADRRLIETVNALKNT